MQKANKHSALHGGKMQGFTKGKKCRGGCNAEEWWSKSMVHSFLDAKAGRGVGRLWKKSKDGNKDDEEGSQVQMEGELCDGHVAKGFTVVLVIFVFVEKR